MRKSATALAQGGTRSTFSSTPPAKAAHAHASGGSLRSTSDWAAAGMAFGPKQRERGEAAMAVLGTAIRRQPHPGKREPVPLAVSFGVDHPARELREPHLDVGIRESPEVEVRLSPLARWVVDAEAHGERYGLALPGVWLPPDRGPEHRHRCLAALALFGTEGHAGSRPV